MITLRHVRISFSNSPLGAIKRERCESVEGRVACQRGDARRIGRMKGYPQITQIKKKALMLSQRFFCEPCRFG